MSKILSFVAQNITPLSQNNRNSRLIARLQSDLTKACNAKYGETLPKKPRIMGDLMVKAFYIHRVPDYKDADNISKPLWDSLNDHAYLDDEQIKYLETLKIKFDTPDIMQLDVTSMDEYDLERLFQFLDNNTGNEERFLYVEINDYMSNKVRF